MPNRQSQKEKLAKIQSDTTSEKDIYLQSTDLQKNDCVNEGFYDRHCTVQKLQWRTTYRLQLTILHI